MNPDPMERGADYTAALNTVTYCLATILNPDADTDTIDEAVEVARTLSQEGWLVGTSALWTGLCEELAEQAGAPTSPGFMHHVLTLALERAQGGIASLVRDEITKEA